MTSNKRAPEGPYPVDPLPAPREEIARAEPERDFECEERPRPGPRSTNPNHDVVTISESKRERPLRICRNARKLFPHWHYLAGAFLCGDDKLHRVHCRERCRRCYQRWYGTQRRKLERIKTLQDDIAPGGEPGTAETIS